MGARRRGAPTAARAHAARGAKVRRARRRRGWTQVQLGAKVGLSQSAISDLEIGEGGGLSLVVWQQVALILDLPLEVMLGRDAHEEPADAGHLGIQELILRLARSAGRKRTFELPTKPADPQRSTDIGLMDDRLRQLIQVECVNTFGNINASVRSADRKRAEAEALAISIGYSTPYAVRQVWVVRATRRNRHLLATYPEIFATRFPGTSRGWVEALTSGTSPPADAGLVWCDTAATRLFEWRARVTR